MEPERNYIVNNGEVNNPSVRIITDYPMCKPFRRGMCRRPGAVRKRGFCVLNDGKAPKRVIVFNIRWGPSRYGSGEGKEAGHEAQVRYGVYARF
jgi:hypothetical protein